MILQCLIILVILLMLLLKKKMTKIKMKKRKRVWNQEKYGYINQKHLRRSKTNTELESFFIEGNSKKQKKELTEEEINKKHEQMMKRKTHTQRLLEEEKRQTIEKILNVLFFKIGRWEKIKRETEKN